MPHAHVIAGDCTTSYDVVGDDPADSGVTTDGGHRDYEKRGRVVCVRKPDDTVLVHDAAGYRPVAWLTRPDAAVVAGDPPTVEARDGDARLRVLFHEVSADARVPVSVAGEPVGPCPGCDGALVRRSGTLACTGCDREYGLPAGAAVLDERCDCGLPRLRVVRGEAFEVCADRGCDPLDDHVEAAFDRQFACPDCGSDLRVVRAGGLLLGCDAYPDCDASYSLPEAELVGTCACGLPAFRTGDRERCLDSECAARGGSGDGAAP